MIRLEVEPFGRSWMTWTEMKPASRVSLGWLVLKSAFILPVLRRPAHQWLQRWLTATAFIDPGSRTGSRH
jgi:hypothetical protein